MSKLCCITDIIWFVIKEEEKLMKGSVHEDDLFIVYDSLVLLTSKETITWMRDNNYFHSWLLPMNGLQDRTPYAGRYVGNIPKFMTLDHILNRDILHSLRFHCVLSRFVLDGREPTRRIGIGDSVSLNQSKFPEDSIIYRIQKREHLLQQGLSNILIWCWKHCKLSTVKMGLQLRGFLIGIDTDGKC